MIDEAKTNPIQPPDSAKQVFVDPFVRKEVHDGLKLDIQDLYRNKMAKSLDGSDRGRKRPWIPILDLKLEHLAVFAPEKTIAGTRIDLCQYVNRRSAAS